MVLFSGVAGNPCPQRDKGQIAAGGLGKAASHKPGAILLRDVLSRGGDKIGRVVYDLILISVQLGDDLVDRGIAAHKVQHLVAGGHNGVLPPGVDKGCCAAEIQRIGNVGVIGVVRFGVLKRHQAAFDLGFGVQCSGALHGGKHTHDL